ATHSFCRAPPPPPPSAAVPLPASGEVLTARPRLQQPVETRLAFAHALEPRVPQPAAVGDRNLQEPVPALAQQPDRRLAVLGGGDRALNPLLAVSLAVHRDDLRTVDDARVERRAIPQRGRHSPVAREVHAQRVLQVEIAAAAHPPLLVRVRLLLPHQAVSGLLDSR